MPFMEDPINARQRSVPPRPAQRRPRPQPKRVQQQQALAGCLAIIILFPLLLALSALLILLAWNVGIVPLVAALGGAVGKIGFWTAFGVSIALMLLQGTVRGMRARA
jgi:fatty acid desaturase